MELDYRQKSRLSKEFGSAKQERDYTDVTILNTPLPQASSTVDGKSMAQIKNQRLSNSEHGHKNRLNFNSSNVTLKTEESSLGIIENISALLDDMSVEESNKKKSCPDQEREIARKLLQKCDVEGLSFTSLKSNKENNANTSNLMDTSNTLSCTSPKNVFSSNLKNFRNSVEGDTRSIGTGSVVFEPKEISARSSELNKTSEQNESLPSQCFSGISYNSNLDAIKAQFNDEDFMSGSKIGDKIFADEMSWRKENLTLSAANNKDELEFSCFSTAVLGNDLIVNGARISASEFFRNKCGHIGHLSTTSLSDRPSFGLNIQSPNRKGKLRPLVNQTVTTEESYQDEKGIKSADCTKDPSIMSLSTINQVLQNLESGSPEKLVDRLIHENKKKKKHRKQSNDVARNTFTIVPSNRESLPASTNVSLTKEKLDEDKSYNLKEKHSLGNEIDTLDRSFEDLLHEANMNLKLKELIDAKDVSYSSINLNQFESKADDLFPNSLILESHSPNASVPLAEQMRNRNTYPYQRPLSKLSIASNNSISIKNQSSLICDRRQSSASNSTITKNDSTAKENTLVNSLNKNQSFETSQIQISEKSQDLCTCLVNIPRETDFEIYNGSERWVICKIKLNQIQGEKENIQLDLPQDEILIEPNATKFLKVGVKMPRMGKLIIANLTVPCCDMVTRKSWNMRHLMCFVPEEPNIKVSWPSNDNFIDFSMVTEDSSNSLPVTLTNKNSIDIPILLYISQSEPQLFHIGECPDDTIGSSSNKKESVNLILKPKQPVTITIDFKGMSLQSFKEKALKGVFNAEANLRIYVCFKENEEYLLNEIRMTGAIGSCKLDILDTQFPLSLYPKTDKTIFIQNSGCVTITASADIVQSKERQSECRDFLVCPNKIVLNSGERLALKVLYKPENNKTEHERHAMMKLTVGNKISFYPIIGEKVIEFEQTTSDSFHHTPRPETPQHLRQIGSPTSMHSIILNRSGNSGRNSPGSTASGGTTTSNYLPLRATHTALVWSSIKVGKSDIKQFTIVNTSNNKIKLIALIKTESQNFKFLKDRQTFTSTMTVSLHGTESKTLFVVFAPNSPKAAAGKVVFTYYSSIKDGCQVSGPAKVVQLYGYGGYGKVEISEAVKDTSGQMWLSLGKMNTEGVLRAKLKLYNKGDLTCFSKLKLTPKALYPTGLSNWQIEPTELLLSPNETQYITLEFRPTKDDFTSLRQSDVIHVGTLKIIHGDEATRLRIRRLHNKLKSKGQFYPKVDQGNESQEIINQISRAFPGEVLLEDLKMIGDSVQNLNDLCKGIVQNEIKLTVELYPDETLLHDNMDDTNAYYSLCSDHENMSHFGGESFLPAD